MATEPVTVEEALSYIEDRHKFPFQSAFDRGDAFPLEKYSIFPSLQEAQRYARGEGEDYEYLAYEGQIIAVATPTGQDVYVIDTKSENNLRQVNSDADLQNIIAQLRTRLRASDIGAAAENHSHQISEIDQLSTALANKASTDHEHLIADVSNLQTTLNEKADATHTHQISDINNLQTTLNGKAASGHTHQISNISGLETRLQRIENGGSGGGGEGGTMINYTVNGEISDENGNFQVGIETIGAAPAEHTHDISQITNLQQTLNNKSNTDHTHDMVTGINVNNTVLRGEVKLVGGNNVDIQQNGTDLTIGITPYESDSAEKIQDASSPNQGYKVFVGTEAQWTEFKSNIENNEQYIVFLRG